MYRTSAVHAVGGFNRLFLRTEDFDIFLRLSHSGAFGCISEPLIEYRLHNTNISNSIGKSGYSQLDYGIAAGVCHLLRQRGDIDPSTANPALWDSLMKLVTVGIRDSGELDYRKWKESWRVPNQFTGGWLFKSCLVFRSFFMNPVYVWQLIKRHFVGSSLPRQCLVTWLRRSSCTVYSSGHLIDTYKGRQE